MPEVITARCKPTTSCTEEGACLSNGAAKSNAQSDGRVPEGWQLSGSMQNGTTCRLKSANAQILPYAKQH